MKLIDEIDALATRFAEIAPLEFNTSPLYQALSPVVATDRDLLGLISERRPGQQPTNLFFGALHFLVLTHDDHPLREFFPSVAQDHARPPADAGPDMLDFCRKHRDELAHLLSTRLVQTNVVKRSAALRLALSEIAAEVPSVHLVEVGASSGIHLLHDQYHYRLNDTESGDPASEVELAVEWRSDDPPADLDRAPDLASRTGIDLHPVDVTVPADSLWLRALAWPENDHEAALLTAALYVVAAHPPTIIEGDVVELAHQLDADLPADEPRAVFHAATRAHVPPARAPLFESAIASLGDRAPLYVISLEGPAEGDPWPNPFAPFHVLKIRNPSGDTRLVALVEGHGDWIRPLP